MFGGKTKWIIGIDEAGRGPLAGPVVVAGVKLKSGNQNLKIFRNIRDSKKLSAKQLDEWFSLLTSHPALDWAFAKVWPKVIDRINISRAANLGVRRVYAKFCSRLSLDGKRLSLEQRIPALLDGSLRLPKRIPHQTIIKGDEKIPIIAAASIIAKVVRDRTMLRLHKKYPQYRFAMHKGYGTKLHKNLIKQFGISEVHRKSFKI